VEDDFAKFGLRGPALELRRRRWLLTLDFEAFTPDTAQLWCDAMRRWAAASRSGGWRFAFFVSVEDVARLRAAAPTVYAEFVAAAQELHASGVEYHPHNHCVFDPDTGRTPTPAAERSRRAVSAYSKGASMYYDVRYRNGLTFRAWLPTIVRAYDAFLDEVGARRPVSLAFRAGGWDYGSTQDDVMDYLAALVESDFSFESGAVTGTYGTRGYRIGLPFGQNVFPLIPPLIEVAPTDSLNSGAKLGTVPSFGWLSRLVRQTRLWMPPFAPGLLVTVLHFDNLFHSGHGRSTRHFAVDDPAEVAVRIDGFFARIAAVRRLLQLEACGFGEIARSVEAILP
jgi:hypothetical protein